ncbi:hypothetical protein Tco_0537664 [Tanacetum coccineum]
MMVQNQAELGEDEVVHKEWGDRLVRAVTTASSLEAKQASGGGLRCQETMGDTIAQTRVRDLEKKKTTQANKIASLKRRIKKLERKDRSRTHRIKRLYKVSLTTMVESSRDKEDLGEDASKQGRRIHDINADEDITLVNDDNEMFDVDALSALKSVKPKVKGDVIEDPSVLVSAISASTKVSAATTTTATIPTPRKGIVIIKLGTPTIPTAASSQQPSQAKKDEANIALNKEWDDIQAKIEADHELAQRLQAEEQEELSVEEKAKLFQQLLEKRRKHFAAKRAEEKRNKPPTQAQQRKIMYTYLKNIEGKKLKDFNNKSFDSIQKMFDRSFKRMNRFVDFKKDLVEGSSKRAGEELEQESTKKQKVDEDKDTTELQSLMEVIPDEEEVAIDAIPLAVKSLTIVD